MPQVEAAYAAIVRKLSPGPGPPLAWPGGYSSVEAFDAAVAELKQVALARVPDGSMRVAMSGMLADLARQWADDREKLGQALGRRAGVGSLLGQIRAKAC